MELDLFQNDNNERDRIVQLRKELHEHNHRYYVLNQPTIGDMEFDMMMRELQDLEAKYPDMADPNSPTQRVGSDLNQEFRQVEHKYPMLSLANTYSEAEVEDFYNSVKKGLGDEEFEICCELKYDGLSISLVYENGKLVKAEYLTVSDHTATLTGDEVKVFFLKDGSYAPDRDIVEKQKP